jgi:hypothetical protein
MIDYWHYFLQLRTCDRLLSSWCMEWAYANRDYSLLALGVKRG